MKRESVPPQLKEDAGWPASPTASSKTLHEWNRRLKVFQCRCQTTPHQFKCFGIHGQCTVCMSSYIMISGQPNKAFIKLNGHTVYHSKEDSRSWKIRQPAESLDTLAFRLRNLIGRKPWMNRSFNHVMRSCDIERKLQNRLVQLHSQKSRSSSTNCYTKHQRLNHGILKSSKEAQRLANTLKHE